MTVRSPFKPQYGSNQVVSATATAASITVNPQAKTVMIANTGANVAYVRVGTGTQTATNKDCPVLTGSTLFIEKADGHETVSYLSPVGASLNIMTGEGGQ